MPLQPHAGGASERPACLFLIRKAKLRKQKTALSLNVEDYLPPPTQHSRSSRISPTSTAAAQGKPRSVRQTQDGFLRIEVLTFL